MPDTPAREFVLNPEEDIFGGGFKDHFLGNCNPAQSAKSEY
jgi:hypothetical protein